MNPPEPPSNAGSRTEAALNLPGQSALSPQGEANRAITDAENLQTFAQAQQALNNKVKEETGELTISTIKIKPKQ